MAASHLKAFKDRKKKERNAELEVAPAMVALAATAVSQFPLPSVTILFAPIDMGNFR